MDVEVAEQVIEAFKECLRSPHGVSEPAFKAMKEVNFGEWWTFANDEIFHKVEATDGEFYLPDEEEEKVEEQPKEEEKEEVFVPTPENFLKLVEERFAMWKETNSWSRDKRQAMSDAVIPFDCKRCRDGAMTEEDFNQFDWEKMKLRVQEIFDRIFPINEG